MIKNPMVWLRVLGLIEGLSFLLLLLVCVPMKRGWYGYPENEMWVKIGGSVHGGLFLVFVGIALVISGLYKWNGKQVGLVLGSSMVPFGFLMIDGFLRAEQVQKRVDKAVTSNEHKD